MDVAKCPSPVGTGVFGVATEDQKDEKASKDGRAQARGFVVMPFGRKKAADGQEIDFDLVYKHLIAPAMADAGVIPNRADQEMRAGGIHGDMFQELLLADLVVADLTIDNANAYYELGVRHALRDNATVSIFSSQRPFLPFDVVGERSLLYTPIGQNVCQETVQKDKVKLTRMIRATLAAWRGRKTSPVYRALPNLEEPAWKNLKVGDINEHWQTLEKWQGMITTALSRQRAGDILLLAEETPNRFLELEALRTAAQALLKLDSVRYGLTIIERGLALDPDDQWLRQQHGIALGRAGRFHEAKTRLATLARQNRSGETLSLLGLSYKDHWLRLWDTDQRKQNHADKAEGEKEPNQQDAEQARDKEQERIAKNRKRAQKAVTFLGMALDVYAKAFRADPLYTYPGINALTLGVIWQDLTQRPPRVELDLMAQGVRWAVDCTLRQCESETRRDYWALATRGELRLVIDDDAKGALEDYEAAAAQAVVDSDRFSLQSTRAQLDILLNLGIRTETVAQAREIVALAEKQLAELQVAWLESPRRIVLFSGHMIDNPADRGDGKEKPSRFPAAKAEAALRAIGERLDRIHAGKGDLALCGGACGGDLLFAEACLERGMALEVRLPKRIPEFLPESVNFADPDKQWYERFQRVKHHDATSLFVMPDEIGPPPDPKLVHDRNNLWQLYSALSLDLDNLHLITLWDGKGKDGPGGTQHMIERIREITGRAPENIDPASL